MTYLPALQLVSRSGTIQFDGKSVDVALVHRIESRQVAAFFWAPKLAQPLDRQVFERFGLTFFTEGNPMPSAAVQEIIEKHSGSAEIAQKLMRKLQGKLDRPSTTIPQSEIALMVADGLWNAIGERPELDHSAGLVARWRQRGLSVYVFNQSQLSGMASQVTAVAPRDIASSGPRGHFLVRVGMALSFEQSEPGRFHRILAEGLKLTLSG